MAVGRPYPLTFIPRIAWKGYSPRFAYAAFFRKSSPGTINWSGNVIDNVIDTSTGNDTVDENAAGNFILSHEGTDTVSGGGGDDFIDVQDQSGGDHVSCGDGTDTVAIDDTDLVNIVDREATT